MFSAPACVDESAGALRDPGIANADTTFMCADAGPVGTTGFCGGECCAGSCNYDQAYGNYTCCALRSAPNIRRPCRRSSLLPALLVPECVHHQCCRTMLPSQPRVGGRRLSRKSGKAVHIWIAFVVALTTPDSILHAGPSGTNGHCSGKCCASATDVCVYNNDMGAYSCCAPRPCHPTFCRQQQLLWHKPLPTYLPLTVRHPSSNEAVLLPYQQLAADVWHGRCAMRCMTVNRAAYDAP